MVKDVRADMAATVVVLGQEEGSRVDAGDTILILESMKMEIPIVAATAGLVTYAVAAGQRVERGAVLARISPVEAVDGPRNR